MKRSALILVITGIGVALFAWKKKNSSGANNSPALPAGNKALVVSKTSPVSNQKQGKIPGTHLTIQQLMDRAKSKVLTAGAGQSNVVPVSQQDGTVINVKIDPATGLPVNSGNAKIPGTNMTMDEILKRAQEKNARSMSGTIS